MVTIEDILFREVELLHICFIATIEEISNIRNKAWYQYDGLLEDKLELIKTSSDGTESWYIDLDDWVGEKNRVYFSSVEMHLTKRPYGEVTEVRISCHNHPTLDAHFKDFVDELITKFRRAPDCEMVIQKASFPPITHIDNLLSRRQIFERDHNRSSANSPLQNFQANKLKIRKPGRPTNPYYEQAFEMTQDGKPDNEVFLWFCKMDERVANSANRKAYKTAMKDRRRKLREKESKS